VRVVEVDQQQVSLHAARKLVTRAQERVDVRETLAEVVAVCDPHVRVIGPRDGLLSQWPPTRLQCRAVDPEGFPKLLLRSDATVRDAFVAIDAGAIEIALVVDEERRLVGTVTDGDVRRALLGGLELGDSLERVLHRDPITAPADTPVRTLLSLMTRHKIHQVPLVDDDGRVIDVAFVRDLVEQPPDTPVVVMAGGEGRRLRPLTEQTPKPMLPVGDRPLLETVLGQVRDAGFGKVLIAVNYRAEMIEDYFGDGAELGLDIGYVREPRSLGSAGALTLVRDELDAPFIVINADLLTNVNLGALLSFHRDDRNLVTIGVRRFELEVPYGVVTLDATAQVKALQEKPTFGFFVNAGVYAVDPRAVALMPEGLARFNMTDLVETALRCGDRVGGFPVREYWLDIGHLSDYHRADADHATYFSSE
jgi:dTDP-glucose pyrophosphorylase